jgi:hypothetical protein
LALVVNAIDAFDRSEMNRLRSRLSESTPLGVGRQSAFSATELRWLMRGTLISW